MLDFIAAVPAVVKPADVAIDHRAALESSYAAADPADLVDDWAMSDAEADALAFDAECYDRYESGAFAW